MPPWAVYLHDTRTWRGSCNDTSRTLLERPTPMTATATITKTLLADREAIAASVLQLPAFGGIAPARAGLPLRPGHGADREAAERGTARHQPVFHWG
jgi:hypothetical protein